MTFSEQVKKELSERNNYTKKDELKAELLGYLKSSNSIFQENQAKFSTENEDNAKRLRKLLENLSISYHIEDNQKVHMTYFNLPSYQEETQNENSCKALVRGVFLGGGSLNNPYKEYHLELGFNALENMRQVIAFLQPYGIQMKQLVQGKKQSAYLKEGDAISKLLAFMGADKSMLDFEEIRVIKDTKNSVNRLVNCETANLNKVVNVSVAQINNIQYLIENNQFDCLPEDLKEIAIIRLQNEHSTLTEIGQMLKKPIGKSGVNYRFKKIAEIAEKLREETNQ